MKFKASVDVMPLKEILDPQGKAVEGALNQLSDFPVSNVRVGKRIEFLVDAESSEAAESEAEKLSRSLLANMIMEDFKVRIEKIQEGPQ
jgi:phosphoribosylformylglycinamidine synthase PurS subunit